MQVVRSANAPGTVIRRSPFAAQARTWRLDPRRFGRSPLIRSDAPAAPPPAFSFGADLKLFLVTFLAGFLFVSILLA